MNRRSLRSRPALHFVLLGLAIYAGVAYFDYRASFEIAAPDEARIEALVRQWVRQSGRMPTEGERQRLVQAEIDGDILVAEALRRDMHLDDPVIRQRLLRNAEFLNIPGDDSRQLKTALELDIHRSDEVIRRRLIQRMETVGQSSGSAADLAEPSRDSLRALYEENPERWRVPPQVRLTHVFVGADRADSEQRAKEVLQQLQESGVQPAEAGRYGEPFLHGDRLPLLDRRALAKRFGIAFAEEVLQQRPQQRWIGPIASAYGFHLVWIEQFVPASTRAFGEVEEQLRHEWRQRQQHRALEQFKASLRARYRVVREQRP